MRAMWLFSPWSTRLLALAVCATFSSCGGGGSSDKRPDGGTAPDLDSGTGVTDSPLCRKDYPAQACDGDPHGQWKLSAACFGGFEGCKGASVKTSGSATASLRFDEAWPEATFQYDYDFDTETRLSVPLSCLNGSSCESIGCFGYEDPCACVLGSSSGGSASGVWMPRISGEVVAKYHDSDLRFCAGARQADSMMGERRVFWERVCTEGMDCRPSNPCHVGEAHCAGDEITCEDTGNNRPVGAVCGPDKVCDEEGACVTCVAGGECAVEGEPCKVGTISCASAEPVCKVKEDRPDGTACGDNGQCREGMCKSPDGAPCTSDSQCEDACTCGDAQCLTRYCGEPCPCGYAPAGGACAGLLDDGTQDPSFCDRACFEGRCLTDIGQRCGQDSDCGSGHCTCWLPNCSGGRLCSKPACPCQWAASGADACGGPLMDGINDLSCAAPQACVDGACQ